MDIAGLLYSSIALMTPILLIGVAELLVEKSGVLNLSIEGGMLIGAFTAFMVAYYTGSLEYSLIVAAFSGLVLSLLFALLTVTLSLDQMVTGLALNLLTIGVTSYLYRASFGWYVSPVPPHIESTITPFKVPLLSSIPLVGDVLFSHIPHTYLAFILVFMCWWVLFKTDIGLRIKAIGEDPQVAEYLGIDVNSTRYILLMLEGVIAGLAGSTLSISYYNMFLDNMTLGKGYVAIALVILGRWNPIFLLGGVFLFSLIDALQLRIQASGILIPPQFSLMLPYVLTIVALVIAGRGARGPSSLAKPYKRVR